MTIQSCEKDGSEVRGQALDICFPHPISGLVFQRSGATVNAPTATSANTAHIYSACEWTVCGCRQLSGGLCVSCHERGGVGFSGMATSNWHNSIPLQIF